MPRLIYFITHPNVVVDPGVPVPQWPLSTVGQARMRAGLAQGWVSTVTSVYSSSERKAVDSADILARHLLLGFTVDEGLGENDRSSTGFVPPKAFEQLADEFFACPQQSVRGWERAVDAQARIVAAVTGIVERDRTTGAIAIMSHGAVGTLLYCHLAGKPISRQWDQPANGGGNFFPLTLQPPAVLHGWRPVDAGLG